MADPRRATLNQSTTVLWSDGTKFNGFLLLAVVMPTQSGADAAFVTLGGDVNAYYPVQRIPQFTLVPIKGGQYDSITSVFFTPDISPPGATYVAWLYDTTRRQVSGPSAAFTVTSSPLTPPTLAVTVPAAGTTTPVLDELTTQTPSQAPTLLFVEDITGTKNGVNTSFTISRVPAKLLVYKNGLLLRSGTGYTWSAGTNQITALAGYIPTAVDIYQAELIIIP